MPRVLQWSRTAILQHESPSHHGTEKTDCSGTFMQRLLRWKYRNVLHARRRSQAFSFAHTLLSVCAVTETSMCQSCTHPWTTCHAAPAAPHHPLCTRLRIHRIRAHARPHNAVHSPSISIYNTAGREVFAIFSISSNFHEDVLLRGLSYKWAHISCLHLTCNQTQFTIYWWNCRQQKITSWLDKNLPQEEISHNTLKFPNQHHTVIIKWKWL